MLAICAILTIILGLIWLFIEFPGLTGWKEVSKESAEGRARQEKWRRDSVILGELQRRGRRVTVTDQLVTDLEEVLVVKSDPKNLRRCSSTKMRRSGTQLSMCNSSSGVSSGDSRQQSPRLEEVHLPTSITRDGHHPSSTRGGRDKEANHSSRGGFHEVDSSLHKAQRGGGGAEPVVHKNCEIAHV